MELGSQKRHRKILKPTCTTETHRRILKVKPYPIPDLEGHAAYVFEKQIREPLTDVQKQMMREGAAVFAKTKRRK